jgi:hypothetical protein
MGRTPEPGTHPLCSFFLAGYFAKHENLADPADKIFAQYELVLGEALSVLNVTKEALRAKPEFNFDSCDAKGVESGVAVLRVVNALQKKNFQNTTLLKSKATTGADIISEKNGLRVCFEVKTITKQSSGRPGYYLEGQLAEKIREHASKARTQLKATAAELKCDLTIYTVVVNWLEHTMVLPDDAELCRIINELHHDPSLGEIDGMPIGFGDIDGVLIVDAAGLQHWCLETRARAIDC